MMNHLKALAVAILLALLPIAAWSQLANRDGEPGNLNYVALGASDAAGIGAFPLTDGYVFQIADRLAARGQPVALYNLGVPTATVDEIDAALELFLVGQQEVDLVTLWTGSNDIIQGLTVAEFAQNLKSMLRRLRIETNAFVVIANLVNLPRLPRFTAEPDPHVTPARVAAFNRVIVRQAQAFRIPVVNLFRRINPMGNVTSDIDGFHPNNRGHRRLAGLFMQVIIPRL
jgi:acyl-CoA thioesterase I